MDTYIISLYSYLPGMQDWRAQYLYTCLQRSRHGWGKCCMTLRIITFSTKERKCTANGLFHFHFHSRQIPRPDRMIVSMRHCHMSCQAISTVSRVGDTESSPSFCPPRHAGGVTLIRMYVVYNLLAKLGRTRYQMIW